MGLYLKKSKQFFPYVEWHSRSQRAFIFTLDIHQNVLANIKGRKIAGKTGQGFLLFSMFYLFFAVVLLIKGYYFGIGVLQFYHDTKYTRYIIRTHFKTY